MSLPFLPADVRFESPGLLLLLLLVAAAAFLAYRRERATAGGLLFSSHSLLAGLRRSGRARARWVLFPLRVVAAVLLVVALARPQSTQAAVEVPAEGIDIVLALDVSSSMNQGDFGGSLSKMEACKRVIQGFLDKQSQDRVGIVVFAGESLVLSPLTLDYAAPKLLIAPLEAGKPVPDGTAIGTGLATALTQLRISQAKAKAVILLTDGENNLGDISPIDAAQLAHVLGVHVYTIGAVAKGDSIDEQMLKRVAELAGGQYYKVQSADTLADIYTQIQRLERTRVGTRTLAGGLEDLQVPLLLAALGLVVLEVVLATTVFRRVP